LNHYPDLAIFTYSATVHFFRTVQPVRHILYKGMDMSEYCSCLKGY
jgi:hypothetical protein